MELTQVRERLDLIDRELCRLITERLDLARDVAEAKRGTGTGIYDPARERAKLRDVASHVPERYRAQAIALFSLIMSQNKAEQQRVLAEGDPQSRSRRTRRALHAADTPFPEIASVACQGVEGAYSQIAATRVFRVPDITYHGTFEGVFQAVAAGDADYGVVPIENSTAGSVNAVYDLLAAYRCKIVRSVRVKVDHNLLASPGTSIEDVREVYSHEQALAQCAGFLDRLGARPHVCENTAQAAEMVARSDRGDIAALASHACADLYGLKVLAAGVQDSDANYTRFVVISSKPEIYAGATRTSLMLTLPHEPGSLYRVLERLFALDINLVKLESRPIPGQDFEFMFYFDLDAPVGSESLTTLLDALDDVAEHVWYLGSYAEVL